MIIIIGKYIRISKYVELDRCLNEQENVYFIT